MHNTKNIWNLSLCLSLAIHLTALAILPKSVLKNNINDIKNKPQEIEVITKAIKEPLVPTTHKRYRDAMLKETPPPYLNNIVNKVFTVKDNTPGISKPMVLNDSLKDAIFSKLPEEKKLKKNPAYMDYYHIIRERIRSKAYHYYNSEEQGQILLTFIISKTGHLERVYMDNASSENKDLIEISLKSIKESSPFPPFPSDLKYPRLQFNISIYFKNN